MTTAITLVSQPHHLKHFMVESVVHPVCWTKVGGAQILGLELIQETTEKIVQIKQRMQAARDRQKSYADLKRVKLASSASGSISQDNTKNNRIRQTQKRAKKNKVEDHLRTIKSIWNKASVVDSKATSSVLNY
nr:reverse transcriptase domain-containing protein [Tanacetum cinerariifolium]